MKVHPGHIYQESINFYNSLTGLYQKTIWNDLRNGLWEDYLIENRIYNNHIGEMRQPEWKKIFPHMHPIYPGFRWRNEQQILEPITYKPKIHAVDKSLFYTKVEEYFHKYDNKIIGVHLSGGLDSSIIICLLKNFNIPYIPIGMKCARYEFRTEQRIQHILADASGNADLYNIEDYPFYSDLNNIVKHQIPDSYITDYAMSCKLADRFAERGVDVVFTGQGGDTILVDEISNTTLKTGFNIGNEFDLPWPNDLIYKPRGIELISFYAEPLIIDMIASLRFGQKEDVPKWWARHFFADILPPELSNYCYSADFMGLAISGLANAQATINLLFEESYDITHNVIFSPQNTEKLMNIDLYSMEREQYIDYCGLISLAVWYHSLFREGNV